MSTIRSRVRARLALWALASGLLLLAPAAHAQNDVAVLGVEPSGVTPATAARFSAALKEHVQRTAGYKLVPGKALEEIKLVFGCVNEGAGCMAKVGRSLKAALLLWGRVEKSKSGGVTLTLKLLDVSRRRVRKTLEQEFSAREAAAPEAQVLALAAKLLPAQAGILRLRCETEGAQVLVDGRPAGLVDIRGVLVLSNIGLGTHRVEVRKDGFRPFVRTVTLRAGQTMDLAAKLVAKVPDARLKPGDDDSAFIPPKEEKKSGKLAWQITFYSSLAATVGLGVGLVVNGLKVLSLEDDKNNAIGDLVAQDPTNPDLIRLDQEGCSFASTAQYSGVHDICEDGKGRQLIQNVLIGVTAAMGALAGFAAYKAFFSGGSSEEEEARHGGSRVGHWQIQPAISPQGASLGLSLSF